MKPNIGQGDKGETHLLSGEKISKDECQIQAYGDIDELNSFLGLVRSFNKIKEVDEVLEKVQEDLFVLCSHMTPSVRGLPEFSAEKVKFLEESILKFEKNLPKLRRFILPSGDNVGALLHVARTVCRRAERSFFAFSKLRSLNPNLLAYLNRLSDLLFILARYVNKEAGKEEKEWLATAGN
jgi:cob(I)alamin adenosyltransferase